MLGFRRAFGALTLLVMSVAGVKANSEHLRRELWVELYVDAAQKTPEDYLVQTAFLFGSISASLPQTPYNIDWNQFEDLNRQGRRREMVGLVLGGGSPLGFSMDLGRVASVSLDLKPVLRGLAESLGSSWSTTNGEFDKRIAELSSNRDAVRRMGYQVYDSYFNRNVYVPANGLKRFPLRGIPAPTDAPSAFLERLTPEYRAHLRMRLSAKPEAERASILEDWPKFTTFVAEGVTGAPSKNDDAASKVISGLFEERRVLRSYIGEFNFNEEFKGFAEQLLDGSSLSPSDNARFWAHLDALRQSLVTTSSALAHSDPNWSQSLRTLSNVVGIAQGLHQINQSKAGEHIAMVSGALNAFSSFMSIVDVLGQTNRKDTLSPLLSEVLRRQEAIFERLSQLTIDVANIRYALANSSFKIDVLRHDISDVTKTLKGQFRAFSLEMNWRFDRIESALQSSAGAAARKASYDFEIEQRLGARSDWTLTRFASQVATLEQYAIEEMRRAPYVIEAGLSMRRDVLESVRRSQDWISAAEQFTHERLQRNGDALKSRRALARQGDEIVALGRSMRSASEAVSLQGKAPPIDSSSFLEATHLIADAIARTPANSNIRFNVNTLRQAARTNVPRFEKLIDSLPALAVSFEIDADRFLSAWDQAIEITTKDFVRDPSQTIRLKAYLLSTNAARLSRDFQCAAGLLVDGCDQIKSAPWRNVAYERGADLLAAFGLIDQFIAQPTPRAFPEAIVHTVCNRLEVNCNLLCLDAIGGWQWSARKEKIPVAANLAPVFNGYVREVRNVCAQFPIPSNPVRRAFWSEMQNTGRCAANGAARAPCEAEYQKLIEEIWNTQMRAAVPNNFYNSSMFSSSQVQRQLSVPIDKKYNDVIASSVSDAALVVAGLEKQLQQQLSDSIRGSNNLKQTLELLDGYAIALLTMRDSLNARCRHRVEQRFLSKIIVSEKGIPSLPSKWIDEKLDQKAYDAIAEYVARFRKPDEFDIRGLADCYHTPPPTEAALQAIRFVEEYQSGR